MLETEQVRLITSYVDCYNKFDVSGLVALLHETIIFENESNGGINARTEGKAEFKSLALQSANMFSVRQQIITDMQLSDCKAMVNIEYTGTLAVDLPNGVKAGERLAMKGKTYFEFKAGKISYIKDVS